MKKTIFFLFAILGFATAKSQVKEGTISYERKTNLHRMIQDEQMRAMMPEYRTSRYQLLFADSISLFKVIPDDEAPDPFAGSGQGRMNFRLGTGEGGELYKNFAQKRWVRGEELGGKNFLITDSIKPQPWKLTGESKQILGHTCFKATRKITITAGNMRRSIVMGGNAPAIDTTVQNQAKPREIDVVAWYAQDMISPTGPENFDQLPGAILEVNIDNGATLYMATEIKKTVDLKELKEPKKGKNVTSTEFNKLRADLMRNQMGNIRIGGQ